VSALPAENAPVSLFAAVSADTGPQVISSLPAAVDLELYAGDDFVLLLEVFSADDEPLYLDESLIESQIRETPESGTVAGQFTASAEGNTITLHLPGAVSAQLPASCAWDVQMTASDGWVTTLAAGDITMTPEVTR